MGGVKGLFPESANLDKVFMLDQNNAWVAGNVTVSQTQLVFRVYKLQFGSNGWHIDYVQDFRDRVNAIVRICDNNVWVVGNSRLFMHKDANGPGATCQARSQITTSSTSSPSRCRQRPGGSAGGYDARTSQTREWWLLPQCTTRTEDGA